MTGPFVCMENGTGTDLFNANEVSSFPWSTRIPVFKPDAYSLCYGLLKFLTTRQMSSMGSVMYLFPLAIRNR